MGPDPKKYMCQMCQQDSKASTVTLQQLENHVYNVTVLICYQIGTFSTMTEFY